MRIRKHQPEHIMKKNISFTLAALMVTSLFAADSTPKDEITSAVKKLADQTSYSWRTTIVVPDDAPFKPGPTDGKTEKDAFTWMSMSMFDNKMEALVKGAKGAIKQENDWKTLEDYDKEEGFARMPAMFVRNLKRPATEAADLASGAKELKKEGDVISGDLTEEGAKKMQTFRGFDGANNSVTDASGSVKFWVKDGALTKYEFKLKGKMKFGDQEFPNERTTTVEIKDLNSTKVEVPEAVRKKLSP
jgi:hypothetical protein